MAMPQPQSPHRPPSVDVLPGALRSPLHQSKDSHSFCTPGPLASSLSLSPSTTKNKNKTTMTTAFTEQHQNRSSKDQQQQQHFSPSLVGGLGNPSISLPWSPSSAIFDQACALKQEGQYETAHGPEYSAPSQFVDDAPSDVDYHVPNNNLPYTINYGLMYQPGPDSSCSRTYASGLGPLTEEPMRDSRTLEASHPPSVFELEPPRSSHEGLESADQTSSNQLLHFNSEYDRQCATAMSGVVKVEGPVYDGGSPYGSVAGTRCSTPHDDMKPTVMTPGGLRNECNDDGAMDKDNQPYAQLIYRALLEAPGHTMILRDIYNWFMANTDKAADKETKGWQNSIRHNLSMNGAFEKVDQPCEESRRGFMWRLTDEAIREGVKSTTRYRSKQPNKRGHRSGNPLPQRQASGAKGGHASRRSAKRRSQRATNAYGGHHHQHRSDPYTMCRSVPASYEHHAGFDPNTVDMSFPYSPSPSSYYGSDIDFKPSTQEGGSPFGAPLRPSGMEMNMAPCTGSSLSQDNGSLLYDAAYVLQQDPSEPLFYATDGSPSPEASEPSTPPGSQVDCYMDLAPGIEHDYFFDDFSNSYRE